MIFSFQILIPIRCRKFRSRKQKFLSRIRNLGKKWRKWRLSPSASQMLNWGKTFWKQNNFEKKSHSDIIYYWNFELKQSIWRWRHLSIKFVKINWTMDFKQVYSNKEVNPKVVLKRLSASTLNIHERVHISDHQRFDNFKAMNEHRVLEWVWIKTLIVK